MIKAVMTEFRRRFPQYQKFSDMYSDMVEIRSDKSITMRDLVINDGMQRKPDVDWIVRICGKFDPFYTNSVRVYDTLDSQYAVWDGQHTTLVLLCVAVYGFDMTLDEAMKLAIPIAIYPSGNVAKLRDRFIGSNDGSLAKQLDKVELFEQYVFAVRHDNSSDPWHQRFADIQTSMEKHGAFFIQERSSLANEPGALSRPTEVYPGTKDLCKWPTEVIDNVLEYHSITNPDLPVQPLEMDNMCHIFRQAHLQGIVIDSDYIRKFAQALQKVTSNTWKKGYRGHACTKHFKVISAYKNFLDTLDYTTRLHYGDRCNQTEVAPTWLCQAVAEAGFEHDVPTFTGKYFYDFPKADLV